MKIRTLIENTDVIVQITIGLIIAILVLTVLVKGLNFSTFWIVINQLQLLLLLALMGVFQPHEVVETIKGLRFASFLFDFIPIIDIFPDSAFRGWADYPQKDERLKNIGLDSGSTLINAFTLIVLFLLLGISNLILI